MSDDNGENAVEEKEQDKSVTQSVESQCKAVTDVKEIKSEKGERIYYILKYNVCIPFYSITTLLHSLFPFKV